MTNTLEAIATELRSTYSETNGLAFPESVKVDGDHVQFVYPAPTVAGGASGEVYVCPTTGHITDNLEGTVFSNLQQWVEFHRSLAC